MYFRVFNFRFLFNTLALSTLVASLLVGCIAPAAAPGQGQPGAAPAEAASIGGELVVYTARAEALFKPVIDAFNQVHPEIKVTMLSGKNGELAAKLLEERANPQADLLVNTDILIMESLDAEGIFEANSSPAVMTVPEDYRAANGSWVSLTLRTRIIMYNTDLVKAEEAPTSVFDLIDPKWKGQIGAGDSTNGAMVANLVAIRHLLGEEKMVELVQGLVANETQFFGSHTDVRKAVGAGELKLGFVNHYYYHLSKAEGAPVAAIYPDQGEGQMGLVLNSTNAGVVQGAPHADLARLFIDFMLSPEGQKLYAELNYEYPVMPGVALAEDVPPLEQFKLADVSLKTMWNELTPAKDAVQAAGLP
jgi:iron(III) transport system substrate-binding protein